MSEPEAEPVKSQIINCHHCEEDIDTKGYLIDSCPHCGAANLCTNCGGKLEEDDYNGAYESRGEFHGAPCSELMCLGYTCPHCGEKVVY